MPYKDIEKRREHNRRMHLIHRERRCHYGIWRAMLDRCYNNSSLEYNSYGGRGIIVCQRWHDFHAFIEDIGFRPTPEHTLDRRDNNKNYDQFNCQWVTDAEQRRNRQASIIIFHDGITLNLCDWADRFNLVRHTLYARYHRGIRPPELLLPPNEQKSRNARSA